MRNVGAGKLILLTGGVPGASSPLGDAHLYDGLEAAGLPPVADPDLLPVWKAPSGGLAGVILKEGLAADVYVARETGSTFELAWLIAGQGLLRPWDAVLALSQNNGRGQLRRPWYSPAGNLHVSFLLPSGPVFEGAPASVLTALLLIKAFGRLGLELKLKWPNDLVLVRAGMPGKLGGLLLEEQGGMLLAGLGVNLVHAPGDGMMREGASLPPALAPEGFSPRAPAALWPELVRNAFMIYDGAFKESSRPRLLEEAEELLLWRGHHIQVDGALSGEEPLRGRLLGLGADGGLRLQMPASSGYKEFEVLTGSISGCL